MPRRLDEASRCRGTGRLQLALLRNIPRAGVELLFRRMRTHTVAHTMQISRVGECGHTLAPMQCVSPRSDSDHVRCACAGYSGLFSKCFQLIPRLLLPVGNPKWFIICMRLFLCLIVPCLL